MSGLLKLHCRDCGAEWDEGSTKPEHYVLCQDCVRSATQNAMAIADERDAEIAQNIELQRKLELVQSRSEAIDKVNLEFAIVMEDLILNDPTRFMMKAFRERWPDVGVVIQVTPDSDMEFGIGLGRCCFINDGPYRGRYGIDLSASQSIVGSWDVLAHELAHAATAMTEDQEVWEEAYGWIHERTHELMSAEFGSVVDQPIPDANPPEEWKAEHHYSRDQLLARVAELEAKNASLSYELMVIGNAASDLVDRVVANG